MSHIESSLSQSLCSLIDAAKQRFARGVVVFEGSTSWAQTQINQLMTSVAIDARCQLGGVPLSGTNYYSSHQGRQLLGRENHLLVVDLNDNFDANSFNAAVGSVIGGGVLVFICSDLNQLQPWIKNHILKLPLLKQSDASFINDADWHRRYEALTFEDANTRFVEQHSAILLIEKVLTGHRKRPLVLTADRGRGKSSALGLAAKKILCEPNKRILVTAPSKNAVLPIFEHAQSSTMPGDANIGNGTISADNHSVLAFISPDELLEQLPDCDLLLVDEAAAIPVPMLKLIIERYHRVVFASTEHGYEGCGRGFSLKFIPWLQAYRPGMKQYQMKQPIRWVVRDPLEAWCADTFLLDCEMASITPDITIESVSSSVWQFHTFKDKHALRNSPHLKQAFSLLVNAHYQTSPNDLMLLLNDESVSLYVMVLNENVVGSVLLHSEGGLSRELVDDIMLGRARPKGHLIPCDLSNHLGLIEPGLQRCARIMRIAVHPMLQSQGVGSEMLARLTQFLAESVDYLATSFGLTKPLLRFWVENNYAPVRLGASKDKSSGTYSLGLVKPIRQCASSWTQLGRDNLSLSLPVQLASSNRNLEPSLAWTLFSQTYSSSVAPPTTPLLELYAKGGNALESCRWGLLPFLQRLVENGIMVDSKVVIGVALLHWTWKDCCANAGFAGKKQAEAAFRKDLLSYIQRLQCKLPL
ncbi:hypothetical protein BCU70_03640 [Vibrio sp. 10N.286.49.C2]|uniref:GNAT family N-acetyltransferase n=1 Tax=unclassified Vibrio TaxID=2614977 RepID=UPI000C83A426|nr:MULTISPECIES: GNAT family N-acetyltransferase [unclassified Vibrio]PMH36694.1 hypothetical protein BCU70_03640 [Vibrio sp. 10N.286.49.C2]PMH54682.1 hypothetical protein BCU66_10255 [Vibrio sp. 10N.286.49.B1]PMH78322.1 hypothetical protein BCU58_09630 [Vibrio sp. 10N.286.48.B7]